MVAKRITAKHITYAVMAFLVGLVILLALSPVIGVRFDTILSGSMTPSINVGDLIIVAPHSAGDLEVGDIIVFHSPFGGTLVCHRIIAIEETGDTLVFHTKGDNNEDPDPFTIQSDSIVGKVQLSVPLMGYAIQWLRGPFGLLAIIAFGAAALLIPEKPKEDSKELTKEDVNGGQS
jgi:signal peptidase